jgi:hypothetical protein
MERRMRRKMRRKKVRWRLFTLNTVPAFPYLVAASGINFAPRYWESLRVEYLSNPLMITLSDLILMLVKGVENNISI